MLIESGPSDGTTFGLPMTNLKQSCDALGRQDRLTRTSYEFPHVSPAGSSSHPMNLVYALSWLLLSWPLLSCSIRQLSDASPLLPPKIRTSYRASAAGSHEGTHEVPRPISTNVKLDSYGVKVLLVVSTLLAFASFDWGGRM
jgi:hypothetical protein